MKKIFFLSLVTFMALTVQAETWSFGGGTMYFDNSTTQWNEAKMMLVIGNECWSEVVEMQPAGEANLWSAALPNHWNGPSYMAVINGTDMWGAGTWGSANLSHALHYSAAYESGLVTIAADEYIFVPQSAENGCTLALYRKGEEPHVDPEPTNLVNWFVPGNFVDAEWSSPAQMETRKEGAENTVYAILTLEPGKEYEFKVNRNSDWYGNGGTMTQAHSTNWTLSTGDGSNCRLATTIKGDYEFAFNTSNNKLSVTYPYNPKQARLYETAVLREDWQGYDIRMMVFLLALTVAFPVVLTANEAVLGMVSRVIRAQFRIGGDEFAVILRGHDLEHVEEIRARMEEQMAEWAVDESLANWEKVSAAFGYAVYDPDRDANADAVFKHADKAMYARKVEMKAVRQ